MQKVILQEDIEKLGHRGDVVSVKPGYARNFLLPHKLAIEATTGNMKALERIRTSLAKKTATETVRMALGLSTISRARWANVGLGAGTDVRGATLLSNLMIDRS